MKELNLDSEIETESDDVIEVNPEVIEEQKKEKQSQITDFFRSQKHIFLSHSNFWFVPYRDRDNFPKNDDLFPIGVFPIGTEDCRFKCVSFVLLDFRGGLNPVKERRDVMRDACNRLRHSLSRLSLHIQKAEKVWIQALMLM